MRDPTIKFWPAVLAPQAVTPGIDSAAREGAPAIDTAPQLVMSGFGRWRLTYHNVRLRESNIRTGRALLSYLAGRLQPIYVGPMNWAFRPAKRANVNSPSLYTFTAKTFVDGRKFERRLTNCTLAAAANFGATQIKVTNSVTAPVSAGDYFELNGRLHLVEDVYGNGDWKIWPPLRDSYAASTVLEIDDPRMLARLDPRSQALAAELQLAWTGFATFDFLEERW